MDQAGKHSGSGLFSELKRRNVFRVALFYIVSAWVIVQVAETLLPVFDVPDSAIRVVVLVLALGFPLAVLFAWIFELTPEGLKLDKNAHVDPTIKQQTSRKLNWATLIVAILAIGLLLLDRMLPEPASGRLETTIASEDAQSESPTAGPEAASIAVLPFEDLSQGGDQAYFSQGIAEEILNVLAGVDGLSVASRTSSFQFEGRRAIGIPEIADHLSVRNVLEGSVRTAGDQIRVTAQLIDAQSDMHLWSQTFDRELSTENLFSIQDEISRAIVSSIRERLDVELENPDRVSASTESVDAYELFLRARALFRSRSFFVEADDLLERALELDSDFADAMALRAAILVVSPEYGVLVVENATASRELAEQLARDALAIDPRLALAHGILGLVKDFELMEGDGPVSYQEVLDDYDAALAIAPDDLASLNWRGFTYLRAGYLEQAQRDFRRCLEVEPGYAPCSSNLVAALTLDKQEDAAASVLDSAIRLGVFTGDIPSLINLHQLGDERGFYFHAIRLPSLRGWLGMEEIFDALSEPYGDHDLLQRRLLAHGEQVGTSLSLDELRLAFGVFDIRPPTYSFWFDAFEPYRRSDQFKRHMEQFGLVEFWRTNGFPPMCRAIDEYDFECE